MDISYWNDPLYQHGTYVALAAGGNGRLSGNKGRAYNSDFIFVDEIDYKRTVAQLIDAINYIFTKADSLDRPCVINVGFSYPEAYYNDVSLETEAIRQILNENKSRIICNGAGNTGLYNAHARFQFSMDSAFIYLGNRNFWSHISIRIHNDDIDKICFNVLIDSVKIERPPLPFVFSPTYVDCNQYVTLGELGMWFTIDTILDLMDNDSIYEDVIILDKERKFLDLTSNVYIYPHKISKDYWALTIYVSNAGGFHDIWYEEKGNGGAYRTKELSKKGQMHLLNIILICGILIN